MEKEGRIWFYYAGEQQVGPLTKQELHTAIQERLLGPKDFVYREGFSDWQTLSALPELATLEEDNQPTQKVQSQKRTSQRAAIRELVVAHNDTQVATGHISNISTTGVFLETQSSVFSLEDEVKLTLKEGKGLGKPLHLSGIIVRKIQGKGQQEGFGIQLKNLDKGTYERIEDYISRNRAS